MALNNNSRVRFGGENLQFYHLNSSDVISSEEGKTKSALKTTIRGQLIRLLDEQLRDFDLLSRETFRASIKQKKSEKKFCSGEVKVGKFVS
jgi:hypothetical protein